MRRPSGDSLGLEKARASRVIGCDPPDRSIQVSSRVGAFQARDQRSSGGDEDAGVAVERRLDRDGSSTGTGFPVTFRRDRSIGTAITAPSA